MSKKAKSQASSSRAASASTTTAFGTSGASFASPTSLLSYLGETPDLSAISDPNIVVAFKSLSKKDSTTKSKALEDLQSLLAKVEVQDPILEAWNNVYPRTSIDTSRRVRQLAHTVHGQIASASGKKIAKYMPRTIGAWLAGLYDNDKLVAKSAQDALELVFPTAEKREALRKAYQEPLLDFVRNAIEKESPQTLSDERSTSPDEAVAKYARVVASSIGLLSSLLAGLQPEDLQKFSAQYDELFNNKALWELALREDSSVRKAAHKFLRTYLQKSTETSESILDVLSSVYIYKGLDSDQSGSASEYLETLIALTQHHPSVWTDHYHGKKSVKNRLKHFLKRGSQGSSSYYWSTVTTLFVSIPSQALSADLGEAEELLKALRAGFTKKDEPRAFIGNGFKAYVGFADHLTSELSENCRLAILEKSVLPILRQFINQDSAQDEWNIPATNTREILEQVLNLNGMPQVTATVLPDITSNLVSHIWATRPEQSRDYTDSQDKLASHGERYSTLLGALLKARDSKAARDAAISSLTQVVSATADNCESRDGKPYGAAAILSAIALSCPSAFDTDSDLGRILDNFAPEVPRLIASPSSNAILTLLRATKNRHAFQMAQITAFKAVLKSAKPLENASPFTELASLVSSTQPDEFERLKPAVQNFITSSVSTALEDTDQETEQQDRWKHISNLMSCSQDAGNDISEILSSLTENLTLEEESKAANILEGLHIMSKQSPTMLGVYMTTAKSANLLHKILLLTESPNDNVAHLATGLNDSLHTIMGQTPNWPPSPTPILGTVHSNLNNASPKSLAVETLISYVRGMLQRNRTISKRALIPSTKVWKQALNAFITPPPPSTAFAITKDLGGAMYLVHDSSDSEPKDFTSVGRDSDDVSVPVRMASYTATLLNDIISFDDLDHETLADIFKFLCVTLSLMNDDLNVTWTHALWLSGSNPDLLKSRMYEVYDFGTKVVNKWLSNSSWRDNEGDLDVSLVWSTFGKWMPDPSEGLTAALYYAEARSDTVSKLIENHGWPRKFNAELDAAFRPLTRSSDTLRLCDFIVEHQLPLANSTMAQKYCNELVADLTYADLSQGSDPVFHKLIVLNLMFQHLDKISSTIAKQRIVFFSQKVITWLKEESSSDALVAELCKLLRVLLMNMTDMYGAHWADALSFVIEYWRSCITMGELDSRSRLPAIHATLGLFSSISRLGREEQPNEDLVDALTEIEDTAASGLLHLLKLPRLVPDRDHRPLQIVNGRLAVLIISTPMKRLQDMSELFSLLDSNCESIQQAAYYLLHKYIPRQQEQVSVNAALDKKAARLPDELLSLILQNPAAAGFADTSYDDILHLLRGYLFSWVLVFDHFQSAVRFCCRLRWSELTYRSRIR